MGKHFAGWEARKTPKATKTPTRLDLAWAAGFLDGEGCFHTNGGNRKLSPFWNNVAVSCAQRYPEGLLDRLQAMFGGSIRQYDTQWNNASGHQTSIIFHWRTSGSRARGIMLTLYPLLSPRRQKRIRKILYGMEEVALGHI